MSRKCVRRGNSGPLWKVRGGILSALAGGVFLSSCPDGATAQDAAVSIADAVANDTSELVAEFTPDPTISLSLSARLDCDGGTEEEEFTHKIRARWQMPEVETGIKRVQLRALVSGGEVLEKDDAGLKGSVMFKLNRPLGGQITVVANAETERGPAADSSAVTLEPCNTSPRPEAGAGFVALPTDDPEPPIAIPGSPIRESDFVHLGGTGDPNRVLMVSAVGTGAVAKLSSWTLATDGSTIGSPLTPVLLRDLEENLVGYNVELHTLSPETSPKLAAAPFVNGILRDGILWLTTRQVNNAGDFLEIDTRGYGGAVSRTDTVLVKEYAMAHRSITLGDTDYFELITPILTEGDNLRILSWAIRKSDGTIFGLQDTGNLVANPASDSVLSITRIKDGEGVDYVTVYKNKDGVLTSILLEVLNGTTLASSGFVFDRGNAASGLNLRGSDIVAEPIDQAVVMPLNRGGYVTRTAVPGSPLTSVWDFHAPGFDVLLVPHRIADHTLDKNPGPGIDVGPVPDLTDSVNAGGVTRKVRARLTDDLWEEFMGVGGGEVASQFPLGEPTSVGIASVTKVMTLLLAVEAIKNGDVALDDIVEVSANAAGTGGSSMNLEEGEKQSLANLMYGMMMVSGNDASVAIAEHVAERVLGGTVSDFVAMMNGRASELGLADTSYNQPAGGGYSTPQDQITLFRFGARDPLFREFAERELFVACGQLASGDPICRNVDKFPDNGYPGIEGWKNGNLGFIDPELKGVPLCTSCLIAKARRADRAMLVGIQQSGARWGDTGKLWDYGFTSLFTPDRVATGSPISVPQVRDVAVDVIDEGLAVTAVVTYYDDLTLCLWNIGVDTGELGNSPDECTTHPDFHLPGNPGVTVTRNLVDGARIPNEMVEGDYITVGRRTNFYLNVDLWRIGRREP